MERIIPEGVHSVITNAIEDVYSLEAYVKPTVVLVPSFIETKVVELSNAIGFDVDTLEYTLGLFLCYPLGMIMMSLPYGKMKHLFSFLLGMFLLQFTIGVQWIHQLITSLVCYVMFLILPYRFSKIAVPVFCMLYITAGHLHRQFTNYLGWDMDFTGPQMVLTIKLYSLSYNLWDGYLLYEGRQNRATKKCAAYAVSKVPGLIEYLGFCFCFSNVLAGPAFEYRTYADACDGSLLYKSDGKPKGKIPSQIWPTLRPFVESLIYMAVFVVGGGKFPILDPIDPQKNLPVVISQKNLSQPWIERYAYNWISLFFIRFKFYFAWKNAEGANNIWYAGFEGFDSKGKALGWENSNNMDVFEFETAPNLRTLTSVWNKKTANWLSRYVYMRTGGSLLATYGMSAFWHGFYPGYYIFFFSVPLVTMCERIARKKISPRFSSAKWSPYGIVCMFATSFIVEYMIMSFQLLALDWVIVYFKSQYFFGHILCFLFYLFASLLLPTPKKKEA